MLHSSRLYAAVAFIISVVFVLSCAPSFDGPDYMNHHLSIDERVDDLVGRMTLEQKASQMVNNAPAINSDSLGLDIPAYGWWNEALHGVARAGIATVFPQAIGLGAMWDTDFMFKVATVISDEGRAKYNEAIRNGNHGQYYGLTFWSPNINIFRDPRWGRGQETYGEDPYLTGKNGVAFVKGMQGDDPKYFKVIATLKHYAVHSGPEPERHEFDAQSTDRDLYETYLPHFRMGIIEGGAYSVMGAYNRFRGESASAHKLLLEDVLRGQWGFDGYLVSDCGAIDDIYDDHKIVETPAEAAALAIKRGMDLNCGSVYYGRGQMGFSMGGDPTQPQPSSIVDAVNEGLLTEDEVDVSLKRLFVARMKLGMFDPPEMVPWSDMPYSVNDSPENAQVALEAARKSIVLLKNENNTLPLSKNLGTIAVIGPNAADTSVLEGNYQGTPSDPVSALRGIQEMVGSGTEVLYAHGSDLAPGMMTYEPIPEGVFFTTVNDQRQAGLTAEFLSADNLDGDPVATEVVTDLNLSYDGAPHEGLEDNQFTVRLSGEIVVPETGEYSINASGFGTQIFIDGQQLGGFGRGFGGGFGSGQQNVSLEAGTSYSFMASFADRRGTLNISLNWGMANKDYSAEAVKIAEQADAVVLVMGISPRLEGEEMPVPVEGFDGGDRIEIGLPDMQEDLIKKIAAVGKPTVLVLMNGSALAVNWADENIPAIVETWYAGQAGGTAIADVLFGDYNPAGRLPVTFYKSMDDQLPFEDYSMENRTYKYYTGDPLYPFGHGLSYTTFAYSDLDAPASVGAGDDVEVSVTVTNTGDMAGEEVVQVYVTDREATVPVPIRKLVGFDRISLAAGESKTVTFTIDARELTLITDDTRRVLEPGVFDLSVGGKQPGFSGTADASSTDVVFTDFTVTGEPLEMEL